VVSPKKYNEKKGLCLAYPINSKIKNYPFEVLVPDGFPIKGVVLADQIKNLDWAGRKAEYICSLPDEIVEDVVAKMMTLFD
jgi:mRNA interferase MazF